MCKIGEFRTDQKQEVVAMIMGIGKAAVSKIERKTPEEVTVARLREYVEAVGGTLEIRINTADKTTVI